MHILMVFVRALFIYYHLTRWISLIPVVARPMRLFLRTNYRYKGGWLEIERALVAIRQTYIMIFLSLQVRKILEFQKYLQVWHYILVIAMGFTSFLSGQFTIAKVNPPERTHRKLLNHTSSFAPDQTTNSEWLVILVLFDYESCEYEFIVPISVDGI